MPDYDLLSYSSKFNPECTTKSIVTIQEMHFVVLMVMAFASTGLGSGSDSCEKVIENFKDVTDILKGNECIVDSFKESFGGADFKIGNVSTLFEKSATEIAKCGIEANQLELLKQLYTMVFRSGQETNFNKILDGLKPISKKVECAIPILAKRLKQVGFVIGDFNQLLEKKHCQTSESDEKIPLVIAYLLNEKFELSVSCSI